ncbi:hypothetical protein C0995_008015 [Termitomyces sp. Mi166|nr:hypothetical protein C0995_008015 [Termitomyces sp. Mi166\
MLFLRAVAILAPPPQLAVVVVTTDPRTPEQYNGLITTQQKAVAVSKSKEKVVPMLSDESDYGESSSEHEQESEEGESVAQHFQHMQYNKKLAAKKANKAKAEAALQHRAINDFSGHIPDGLGVKVWGPLNVEQLNLCFTGALSDSLHVMHALDPSQPFDLEQIAQYALIFGWPELENTWQGIAFDFAYHMHWQTLFGFALCWALCTTSAAKPAVVRRLALVMA